MLQLILSFIAGALTIAAPCILPLLPVIVGSSIVRGGNDTKEIEKRWYRPLLIALGLIISIVVFGLILKSTTALLGVPQVVWQVISGGIVLLFGANLLFPALWEKFAASSGLQAGTNKLLGKSYSQSGVAGDLMVGAALGPVFSSCSPTYSLIIATILPASFLVGFVNLVAYALGLAVMLILVAYVGQALVQKLGWLADPHGNFRKVIGTLFIIVGIMVLFGLDKKLQAFVLEKGWYNPINNLERRLMR